MAEDCEANEKISLTFLNGTGFIFNVNGLCSIIIRLYVT